MVAVTAAKLAHLKVDVMVAVMVAVMVVSLADY